MKNIFKLKAIQRIAGIIALVAIMGFSMTACGGGDDGGGGGGGGGGGKPDPKSVTYFSKDGDGNLYTLEITEDTSGTSRYAVKQGDFFKLTVDLYNDGEYKLMLSYEGRIGSTTAKNATEILISITVNGKPLNITISGTTMTVISGTIVLDDGKEVTLTDTDSLIPIETPEDLPDAKRWQSWTDSSATATITYSVDKDGVCTIIIGGIPQPNNETDNWGKWKAQAIYGYTAKANARYAYKFEAWTDSDERILGVQYYSDNDENIYLGKEIELTTTRTTFTIYGDAILKNNSQNTKLIFSGADQLGKFYLKILSISEYEESERWWKYVSDSATATLDYSVADDGVCTITVGGTAETGLWDKWKAQAGYVYNANAGTPYEYVFEAWTDSGSRTVNVQYYGYNYEDEYESLSRDIILTSTRTTYTIIGDGIPNTGAGTNINLIFQCADQTGKFYVKIVSIKKPIAWSSSGNYDYIEYASTVVITGYNGSGGNLTIPGGFNGKPVSAIGNWAFCSKQLTGVTIPNTVISIGDWAFDDNQLNNVTFATTSKVTTIGKGAFTENPQLTSVTIPNSVISIGDDAFKGNQMTSVTFAANSKLVSIGDFAFANNQLTSVSIPNSVTHIGWGAFESNRLNSVSISSSVTNIRQFAFANNQLKSVTIPNSVNVIWFGAFVNNPLTSVTIGANITLNQEEDEPTYVFPGNLDDVYNNGGKTSGTYKGVIAQNDEHYDNTSWSKN